MITRPFTTKRPLTEPTPAPMRIRLPLRKAVSLPLSPDPRNPPWVRRMDWMLQPIFNGLVLVLAVITVKAEANTS